MSKVSTIKHYDTPLVNVKCQSLTHTTNLTVVHV